MKKKSARPLGLSLPTWAQRTLGMVGLGSIIYGLIRYTFVGELFERVYEKAVGHSPVDDLVDSLDPRNDIKVMKEDMRMIKNALD